MEFEIEKGVPIPPKSAGCPSRKGETKYPFLQMEPQDSIFFKLPGGTHTKKARQKVMSGLARIRGLKPERMYVWRNVEGGMRIWRVE